MVVPAAVRNITDAKISIFVNSNHLYDIAHSRRYVLAIPKVNNKYTMIKIITMVYINNR